MPPPATPDAARCTRHALLPTLHHSRFTLAWLAPSVAALTLLALLLSHPTHQALSPKAGSNAVIALAMSNQNFAAFSAASSNEQYAVPAESLALTNFRPFSPTPSPRSPFGSTN